MKSAKVRQFLASSTNVSDIRRVENIEGHRSINLALSKRGITALEKINIDAEIMASAIPMRARMIHEADGHRCTPQPYGDFGEVWRGLTTRT